MTEKTEGTIETIVLKSYRGSCHCGAVQFTAQAPDRVTVQDCNCSICSKTGFLHLIIPRSRFTLLQGKDEITTYTFNTGVAQHTFCKICGCKPFYIPRSNPDGIDVNLRKSLNALGLKTQLKLDLEGCDLPRLIRRG